MTYKLKLLVEINEEEWEYVTAYIDVTEIQGFWIAPEVDDKHDAINIFLSSGMMTIMKEKHIVTYLNDRFKKPVKNEY